MKSRVDLHLHSTASDGSFSPERVVELAAELDMEHIAITDHDTASGVAAAIARGNELGVDVIPAIEINADLYDTEVHTLGYFIDYAAVETTEFFSDIADKRRERVVRIVKLLNRHHGFNLDPEQVLLKASGGIITRAHINKTLVEEGIVVSMKEANEQYTGRHCQAYVERPNISPVDAIRLVRELGGIPVVAHPGRIGDDRIVLQMIEAGVQGVEAYYSQHSQSQTEKYLQLAEEYKLLVTGGSDCHGPKYNAGGAVTMGSVRIPGSVVTDLKEFRRVNCK